MQCCSVFWQGKNDGQWNNPPNLTTDEHKKPYQESNQDGEPVEESCLPASNSGCLVLTTIIMASGLCRHEKKNSIIIANTFVVYSEISLLVIGMM